MSRFKDIYIEEMERIAQELMDDGAEETLAYHHAADLAFGAMQERIRTSPEFTRQ